MELIEAAVCQHCKVSKPLKQLNGHDPLTGDVSAVYCRELLACDSEFAAELLAEIIAEID